MDFNKIIGLIFILAAVFGRVLLSYCASFVDKHQSKGWIPTSRSLPTKKGEYCVLLRVTQNNKTIHIPWKANYVDGMISWKIAYNNRIPTNATVRVEYWIDYPYEVRSERKK